MFIRENFCKPVKGLMVKERTMGSIAREYVCGITEEEASLAEREPTPVPDSIDEFFSTPDKGTFELREPFMRFLSHVHLRIIIHKLAITTIRPLNSRTMQSPCRMH